MKRKEPAFAGEEAPLRLVQDEHLVLRTREKNTAAECRGYTLHKSEVHAGEEVRLEVSLDSQTLFVLQGNQTLRVYPISTSKFGVGTEEGSFRTPKGSFRIAEKIGDGAPPWSVFRGRKPTGEIAGEGGEEDLVLTRILWLDGLEPENQNTKDRYIYIHGTNQEKLLGTPASHGCVRISNEEAIELFDQVREGTPVEIV